MNLTVSFLSTALLLLRPPQQQQLLFKAGMVSDTTDVYLSDAKCASIAIHYANGATSVSRK